MGCVHIMSYYSAVKRKEILTHFTIWKNFEDMLSEISHEEKNILRSYLCEVGTESRKVIARS